ncbi:nitrile hydratase subunit beta [cf. Phormidesmis sp. LEGE 11477]|uniref:nitrile hydratase subunit beta n=1 Tax=cf. Phormidesmis sp. LEGE 11477 TaxID=1828680 RepID=UPI0018818352|nr:nitrile hydratase subunit beta [cf. Phormidesmis sp. LEGE 11477]MBE9061375.1 nitrile hydratase subunit beta [cf. Phormidesmis sp. LEGE 11477]
MKLQHNIGGIENLDPINFETRVFVEPWEERIFGIHTAMMALSNHLGDSLPDYKIDQVPTEFKSFWTWGHLRMGAESLNPFEYFRLRYYEKWLGGISGFFVEEGYITQAELDERTSQYLAEYSQADATLADLPKGGNMGIDEQVMKYLEEGDSPLRPSDMTPKFSAGDRVKVKNVQPGDHTRLPGHLRGKAAEVVKVYEDAFTYFFPTADGLGSPMPVYSLAFQAKDIWLEDLTDPNMVYYNDIFEVYIEAL